MISEYIWPTKPAHWQTQVHRTQFTTRMWANANVMAALTNIGGALCSTPQSLADAHYYSAMQ